MKAFIWLCGVLVALTANAAGELSPHETNAVAQTFMARGIVTGLKPDSRTISIRHEAISNYMAAMTMPFRVKDPDELDGVKAGDRISFRLQVTETESWVDQITRIGRASVPQKPPALQPPGKTAAPPLLNYHFTNELGAPVSLNDFHGQALAITFIFTRCPLPEYCPRLSKNFQEASQKLAALTNAPANWHFLSVTFDPDFDTPAMLQAYGNSYGYDPAHWSFLTGPADKLSELAQASGVTFESDAGSINHNFRTLIIDATGHLQMVFPTSGDLSDSIVVEIIKAAAATR